MTPFSLAAGFDANTEITVKEIMRVHGCTKEQAQRVVDKSRQCLTYVNDLYQVAVFFDDETPFGKMIHLSIKRRDKEPARDWRHMQAIKNELTDPEYEAVEIYPAESRLIDGANQYHLWVFANKEFRLPIGFFEGRQVSDTAIGKGKQRPLGEMSS